MNQSDPNRVFLFGAGASVFAGFPLGRTLWHFLIDHCGFSSSAIECLDAYLSILPEEDRVSVTSDLELLLTELEEGGWPRAERLINVRLGPNAETSSRLQAPEDKDAFLAPQRHLLGNLKSKTWARMHFGGKPGDFDLDGYYQARLIRRAGIARAWYPISMLDFIGDIRCGFLNHHACILYGGKHHTASPDPAPERFSDVEGSRCPCYREFSLRKISKTIDAIASYFRRGDTLITFNWDALLESVLWNSGKWTLSDGYGIPVRIDQQRMRTWRRRLSKSLRPSPIKVLKAHGSINWVKNVEDESVGVNCLGLLFDLPVYSTYSPYQIYDEEGLTDYPYIKNALLAPTYRKAYSSDPVLSRVWNHIVESVERASEITVIGYSLPLGDQTARESLALGLRQNKQCKTVAVVTPSIQDSQWPEFLDRAEKKVGWIRSTFQEWVQGESEKVRLAQ